MAAYQEKRRVCQKEVDPIGSSPNQLLNIERVQGFEGARIPVIC